MTRITAWLSKPARRPLLAVLWCLGVWFVNAQPVYKYQTADGHWHFTDTPPANISVESVDIRRSGKADPEPRIRMERIDAKQHFIASNPWFGPLEFVAVVRGESYQRYRTVVVARAEKTLFTRAVGRRISFQYYWIPGDPSATQDAKPYSPPLKKGARHVISQGYGGAFSHQHQPNRYAIDIVLPIGSPVHAARAGRIMAVTDKYVIGSAQWTYFYDKANYVMIIHDDGTTAVYAHLLQGSIFIKPGQRVRRGELIARSGNSGYSSGPHLHFVVRGNIGGKLTSLPVRMLSAEGQRYEMRAGENLLGW